MRTSLRLSVALLATATLGIISALSPAIAATFSQKEVDQNKIIAIAAPLGSSNYQLLILEQLSDEQACWSESGTNPVVVDPLLLKFDFTGICARSTDSNGYSIRMADRDIGLYYRLSIFERDGDIVLVGISNNDRKAPPLEIGRTNGIHLGFSKIVLEPGWQFTKRTVGDKVLGHIYREQLVSLVIEALRKLPNANLNLSNPITSKSYPDVDASRWSAAKIQFARDNKIISGYADGNFRPTQTVTRAEFMAVLRRAAEFGKSNRGLVPGLTLEQPVKAFSDTTGHWAGSIISQMSSYCSVASPLNEVGNEFAPDSETYRSYAAAATVRMLNCVEES